MELGNIWAMDTNDPQFVPFPRIQTLGYAPQRGFKGGKWGVSK